MSEFVCVETFEHEMEADLAKNVLVAAGLQAMLTRDDVQLIAEGVDATGPIRLIVDVQDKEKALEVLAEGNEELGAKDFASSENIEEDLKAARKEFDEIKKTELQNKAAAASQNGWMGIACVVVAIGLLIYSKGQGLVFRLGLAAAFLAVVQFFVWKDGVQAKKKLEEVAP